MKMTIGTFMDSKLLARVETIAASFAETWGLDVELIKFELLREGDRSDVEHRIELCNEISDSLTRLATLTRDASLPTSYWQKHLPDGARLADPAQPDFLDQIDEALSNDVEIAEVIMPMSDAALVEFLVAVFGPPEKDAERILSKLIPPVQPDLPPRS
jgi:hypothetical protein